MSDNTICRCFFSDSIPFEGQAETLLREELNSITSIPAKCIFNHGKFYLVVNEVDYLLSLILLFKVLYQPYSLSPDLFIHFLFYIPTHSLPEIEK